MPGKHRLCRVCRHGWQGCEKSPLCLWEGGGWAGERCKAAVPQELLRGRQWKEQAEAGGPDEVDGGEAWAVGEASGRALEEAEAGEKAQEVVEAGVGLGQWAEAFWSFFNRYCSKAEAVAELGPPSSGFYSPQQRPSLMCHPLSVMTCLCPSPSVQGGGDTPTRPWCLGDK